MRVVITGASSGIGAELARCYASQSAQLGLIARRGDELRRLADDLGGGHRIYPVDVSDASAMAAAAANYLGEVGVPNLVIANAGISVGTLTQAAEDRTAIERVFQVNVFGMINTLQPFVAPMLAARRGTLVGIASVAGIRGLPGAGAYSASKSAVISYLESLRVELRGSGIRVVTIAPGYIATPMTAINEYPMPFILPVDEAARRIVRAIDSGRSYAVIPWQMAIVAKLLRLLPNPLFDAVFARAGRKPRRLI